MVAATRPSARYSSMLWARSLGLSVMTSVSRSPQSSRSGQPMATASAGHQAFSQPPIRSGRRGPPDQQPLEHRVHPQRAARRHQLHHLDLVREPGQQVHGHDGAEAVADQHQLAGGRRSFQYGVEHELADLVAVQVGGHVAEDRRDQHLVEAATVGHPAQLLLQPSDKVPEPLALGGLRSHIGRQAGPLGGLLDQRFVQRSGGRVARGQGLGRVGLGGGRVDGDRFPGGQGGGEGVAIEREPGVARRRPTAGRPGPALWPVRRPTWPAAPAGPCPAGRARAGTPAGRRCRTGRRLAGQPRRRLGGCGALGPRSGVPATGSPAPPNA